LAGMLTKHAAVGWQPSWLRGLAILAMLDFHEMDVLLIGCELTGVSYPGPRLVLPVVGLIY